MRILERAVGSWEPTNFRHVSEGEALAIIERATAARMAQAGIFSDPFAVGGRKRHYQIVRQQFRFLRDPFRVSLNAGVELPDDSPFRVKIK